MRRLAFRFFRGDARRSVLLAPVVLGQTSKWTVRARLTASRSPGLLDQRDVHASRASGGVRRKGCPDRSRSDRVSEEAGSCRKTASRRRTSTTTTCSGRRRATRRACSDRRTSLIFDPADGKIPPLTPAAQQRAAARAEAARRRGPADAAEYRSLGERCISWGNEGPPMLGATYYNNLQIFQTGQDRGDPARADARHTRHPAGREPARRTESSHAARRLRAAAGKATRSSSTRPISPTGRRSGARRRRHAADIFSSENLHVIERFTRVGRRRNPLPVHCRRSRDVGAALVCRDHHAEVGRPDLRVRVPRRQLRPRVHPERRPRGGWKAVGLALAPTHTPGRGRLEISRFGP